MSMFFNTTPLISLKLSNPEQSSQLISKSKRTECRTITVSKINLQKIMNIYRWRTETQFPISKINSVQFLVEQEKNMQKHETICLQIKFQPEVFTLADICNVPLFKILYLLKQSLIGLERLFNKFGPFLLTNQMININQDGKCKVWINKEIHLNQVQLIKASQQEFLANVYGLFQSKTIDSKQSSSFFGKIKFSQSFFSALECIDSFVEKQKIKISINFKLYNQVNSSTSLQKKKKKNTLNLTMSKRPNFLNSVEFNCNKNLKTQRQSKQLLIKSSKQIPKRSFLPRPPMKISGDTRAQSIKNTDEVNAFHFTEENFTISITQSKKEGQVWCSGKQQRPPRPKFLRKFSNNVQNKFFEKREDHPSVSSINKDVLMNSIAESMIFDENNNFSRSSSANNLQMMSEKKKEVFSVNGWQLKVNSLFNGNEQFKKSYINKDKASKSVKEQVKLDLLDKHTNNLYQSFMTQKSEQNA